MKTFKAGQTIESRSICDHNCIFKIKVISRTKKMANIIDYYNRERKTKIKVDTDGDEYIQPYRYSFAPVFRAI